MVRLPPWVFLLVGGMVILFGIFRIVLSLRPAGDQQRAQTVGGLFGYKRRTNFLVGVVYIAMGLLLVLPPLGVNIHMPWQR